MGLTAKFNSHEISIAKSNFGEIEFTGETFLLCFGNWLEGSQSVELISAAEIRTPGSAEAILSAGRAKRTNYVHQVNAAALLILLHQACEKSKPDDMDTLIKTMRSSCAQFSYWYTISELECILILFVQSIKEGYHSNVHKFSRKSYTLTFCS